MITHSPIIFTDLRPAPAKARARRTDPQVSHNAAKRVEESGVCEIQRLAIYDILQRHGPQTVKEMATRLAWTKDELGKRVDSVRGIAPNGESRNGSRVWAML